MGGLRGGFSPAPTPSPQQPGPPFTLMNALTAARLSALSACACLGACAPPTVRLADEHPAEHWTLDYESAAIWRVTHTPPIPYVLLPQILSLRTPQHANMTVGGNDLTMRSRFSLLVEPIASGPESLYLGLSAGPSLEYWLAGHQACCYAGAGGGFGLIDSTNVPGGQGQDFTLNWYATGGVRYYPQANLALNAGVFFQHLSNGGATDPNPGLNCLGPVLGLSWHF